MEINLSDNDRFNNMTTKLKEQGAKMGRVSDLVVAEVAAKGRRLASKREKEIFKFEKENVKYYGPNKKYSSTKWDSQLGGYKDSAGRRRMINFKYESSSKKKRSLQKGVSIAQFSSLIANLNENDTKAYTANSPFFTNNVQSGRFKIGSVRKGKKYFFTKLYPEVQAALPQALESTEVKIQTELTRGG